MSEHSEDRLRSVETAVAAVRMMCNAGLLPEIVWACRQWVNDRQPAIMVELSVEGKVEAVNEARQFVGVPDLVQAASRLARHLYISRPNSPLMACAICRYAFLGKEKHTDRCPVPGFQAAMTKATNCI